MSAINRPLNPIPEDPAVPPPTQAPPQKQKISSGSDAALAKAPHVHQAAIDAQIVPQQPAAADIKAVKNGVVDIQKDLKAKLTELRNQIPKNPVKSQAVAYQTIAGMLENVEYYLSQPGKDKKLLESADELLKNVELLFNQLKDEAQSRSIDHGPALKPGLQILEKTKQVAGSVNVAPNTKWLPTSTDSEVKAGVEMHDKEELVALSDLQEKIQKIENQIPKNLDPQQRQEYQMVKDFLEELKGNAQDPKVFASHKAGLIEGVKIAEMLLNQINAENGIMPDSSDSDGDEIQKRPPKLDLSEINFAAIDFHVDEDDGGFVGPPAPPQSPPRSIKAPPTSLKVHPDPNATPPENLSTR